ncbi:MAG: NifB/NifX family molybdenum-iron cluster-binding protein [Ignavibacteria bacterium]|jgi:predicted Fe-Mo cluster-binding NifX family protein|nr:NifB/NifX family molybdenum-iron cluster-binding protein [Ignavibacteria bacterium]
MKIAIPSNSGLVEDHFGHCEYFTVYTITDDNKIADEMEIASAHGCGCKSDIVETLHNLGVKIMLAGNIGGGAVNKLSSYGIAVVRGCSGAVSRVIEDWLEGKITDSGELCRTNEHHHGHGHDNGNGSCRKP